MVLSKRERYIAIGTSATLGLVVLYSLVIGPKLEDRSTLADKIDKAKVDLENGDRSIKRSATVTPIWTERVNGPLTKTASLAESQALENVVAWGKEAGMTAMSINKPDRIEKEKDFSKITFRATARSGIKQLGAFMYRIQTAKIPVRITDLTVTAPKEATDELQMQMSISTIFLSPEPDPKPSAAVMPREGTP